MVSSSTLIAPSILSADFGRLAADVQAVTKAGADRIHVDVMDGRYVPNLTIGPVVVEAVRKATDLPLDVHLMIVEPERYFAEFVKAGADIISVHAEACVHLHRALQQIRDLGLKAGVALNPHTPIAVLEHILGDLDQVIIMTVNPGFGGQSLIKSAVDKVAQLDRKLHEAGLRSVIDIAVDGGVNTETASEVATAGANVLVAGSAVFKAASYEEAIASLRDGEPKTTGV